MSREEQAESRARSARKPGAGDGAKAKESLGGAGFLASAWRHGWLPGLLLVAAVMIAYHPAWHGGFIWDDESHVVHNRLLFEPDGLKRIWFSLEAPQYYPLVFTTFRLERALWGLHPEGYHFVNLCLHSANALLLWRLLRQLRVRGAWLAAAVFALHPVNVESVAWITERKNTLSLFFFLLSLLCYLRFDQQSKVQSPKSKVGSEESKVQSLKSKVQSLKSKVGGQNEASRGTDHASRPSPSFTLHPPSSLFSQGSRGRSPSRFSALHAPSSLFYGLSLLAFVLALFSKTAVAPLPVVLLLLAWWRRGRITGRDVGRVAPFLAAALVLIPLTVVFEHQAGSEIIRSDSFWSRLAGAGWAVWFYLYKAVLPFNLSFVYPRWRINPAHLISYVPGLLAVGGLVVCWRYRRGWGRALLFGLGYFVVMLLPALGFVNIYFMRYSLVSDHWQYAAIIGPIALGAAGIGSLKSKVQSPKSPSPRPSPLRKGRGRGLLGVAVCGVMLVGLGALTWQQCGMYADNETLWRTSLRWNPNAWLPHYNLGTLLAVKGRLDEAVEQLREAIRVDPGPTSPYYNLAKVYALQHRMDDAIASDKEALQRKPNNPKYLNDLAWIYATCPKAELRNGTEAVSMAEAACKISKRQDMAMLDTLAAAYAEAGRFDEAVKTTEEIGARAASAHNAKLAETARQRLELYQARKPYRDEQ